MCEEQAARLHRIRHSLATGVPRIVVQRAEEIFPALGETVLSVLYVCPQKSVLLLSVSSHDQRN
jgi:hypothetical protein